MKKIDLFNRNTNSPSYRRMPVSRGFNRGGGIPLFSGMTVRICGMMIAIAALFATPSFAEPTELDKKTVASKAYVDTKQDIIETSMVETWGYTLPSLVTYDSTDGGLTGTKFGVLRQSDLDSDGSNLRHCTGSDDCEEMLPTGRAVGDALNDLWENMPSGWTELTWNVNNDNGANRTAAINAYNTTFGTGTNQWAETANATDLINGQFLANSLALKQNKIETGLVEFEGDDATINVPSVVTTNAAGTGVSGNQIGFMTLSAFASTASPILDFKDRDDGDSFVPSAALMAAGLSGKQNILPAAWTDTTSIYAMASTGGLTIELGRFNGTVNYRYITAGGSQPLTQKSGAHNVMLYINGTKTLAQYQISNFGGTGGNTANYINGALVSLELLKDVYGELNAKITNNALPTGTTGTVVTYNGTNATTGVQEFGERAVYDPANTYNAQTDATKLATMASVKYVCAGYEPAAAGQPAHDGTHPGDEDYC